MESTEAVPDSFVIHSGMQIVYADPTFCTLIGAESQAQLIGTSLTDIVGSDTHAAFREQVTRIENEAEPVLGLTVELQTAAGRQQNAIAVSSLIEWDGTQHVQTAILPITESGASGAQLLQDQAMDEAPIGITISDPSQPDNPLIYVNDGFSELTGYPRDEILGQNCRFLQGDATREEPVAKMRAAIDTKEPVTVELRNYRKSGSVFWSRVTILPIRSHSGRVTNWIGYQQDISDEKRYEQDLTLFKQQAEGSDKAIIITDPDGTIEYVNPAFERLTGYTAAEATGLNPRILKSGQQDEAFYADLWEEITAGEVWEAELTNQTKQGELFEVKQKIIPVTDDHGEITHFVGIEQDITEKVLTTQTLDVLNRVLRHNLRNALNAIDGYAALLESTEMDFEERQASIAAIRDQTESMQQIAEKTAEIRAIWDPSENHQTWERFDIQALVETYRRQYPDADIAVTIECEGTPQVRSSKLFRKAMDEAVENAIEHSEQSPVEVMITVRRASDANQMRIAVADNGPGIPALEQNAIEAGKETPLSHSLGVGLWLMEWVTTTLGGELTITDNDPRGSVVTFQLPAAGLDDSSEN